MSNDESSVPRLAPVVNEPESWLLGPLMLPLVIGTPPFVPLPPADQSHHYRETDRDDPAAEDEQIRPPTLFRRFWSALARPREIEQG
jgi:hypothetical protein